MGWQSFILYGITPATGIQGPFTRVSNLEAIVLGFLGTFLINLFRITSVAVVAYHFGQLPALIYHDYGGTVLIIVWLFVYWYFSHGWVLEPLRTLPDEPEEEKFLREIHA